jgi:hypothetical protein
VETARDYDREYGPVFDPSRTSGGNGGNIDRAILDGHLKTYPNLDGVKIMFSVFAEKAEQLNYHKPKGERAKSGSTPSGRDDLLEIFHRAWVALRELESDGFPLMDYVETRA